MRDWKDEIDNDLQWREQELLYFKKMVFDTRDKQDKNIAILRALWVMLYAHYEGFCKFVWDIYLDHINHENISNQQLSKSIMMVSLSKVLDKQRKGMTNETLFQFCNVDFSQCLEQIARFDDDNKLSTQSNLYPNVSDENNIHLSLSISSLNDEDNRKHIKALVSRRNDIAHGKKMYIRNLKEYNKYEESAFQIMIDLACEVIDAIDSKAYINAD